MRLKMTKVDVWAAEIDDRPGGLALTMRAIADYGADLDCVLARRMPDKPGKGVVFVTPLKGREQLDHAVDVGLKRATNLATLKIEGTDRPALGAELTKAIGDAGVSLHGLTAAVIGRRFVCYASFDTVADMEKARDSIEAFMEHKRRNWREMLRLKRAERQKKEEKVKIPA